jgi:hypothetical protein
MSASPPKPRLSTEQREALELLARDPHGGYRAPGTGDAL